MTQPSMTRGMVLAASLLVVIFIILRLAGAFNFYDALQIRDKIDFWVAVGTIGVALFTAGLAIVTAFSVVETQTILRAEDIRHQEQYAPFVTLELASYYEKTSKFSIITGFQLSSKGLGPAIVTGYELKGAFHRPRVAAKPDVFEIEKGEEVPLDLSARGISWYIRPSESMPVSAKEFEMERGAVPGGVPDIYIVFGSVVVSYLDMFGNHYNTVYEDFGKGSYRWVKPAIEARPL